MIHRDGHAHPSRLLNESGGDLASSKRRVSRREMYTIYRRFVCNGETPKHIARSTGFPVSMIVQIVSLHDPYTDAAFPVLTFYEWSALERVAAGELSVAPGSSWLLNALRRLVPLGLVTCLDNESCNQFKITTDGIDALRLRDDMKSIDEKDRPE